jgi:hypothetical protein
MTDANGIDHRCLLMHNPWGSNDYSYTWNADDSNWTTDLIEQIPYDFDPTAQSAEDTGLFVAPVEAF